MLKKSNNSAIAPHDSSIYDREERGTVSGVAEDYKTPWIRTRTNKEQSCDLRSNW